MWRHDRPDPAPGAVAGAPPPPPFTRALRHVSTATMRAARPGRPGLVLNPRVAVQSSEELRAYLRRGNPGAGMPGFADLPADDLAALARYLRRINVEAVIPPPPAASPRTVACAAQPGMGRTYNGNDSGNRYSALTQIPRANVGSLKLKWVFRCRTSGSSHAARRRRRALRDRSEPCVWRSTRRMDRALWTYSRPPTPGLSATRSSANRGVALRGDTVYFVTTTRACSRSIVAPARRWETPWPGRAASEGRHHYGGTIAPLVVRDMVVAGSPARCGFADSSRPSTPSPARWCVAGGPCPDRATRIETWQGPEPLRGRRVAWLTGSYDPSSDTLYWSTGNPWPVATAVTVPVTTSIPIASWRSTPPLGR